MKKSIKESFDYLDELLRKVDDILQPNIDNRFKWLMNKDERKKLFEQKPKCFLPINIGREVPFFPICNRMGVEDPAMIALSLKIADRLSDHPKVDRGYLVMTVEKLESLKRKYEKEIAKPTEMAIKKGAVTKSLNKIKAYTKAIKGM